MAADELCANTIRVLAADMVQKANSGHPGAPMGLAAVAHALFSKVMKYNPKNPKFWNRDRFVLSNGHACALYYTMLHLSGFDVSLDDLKAFRSLGAKTPGHPESHRTPGIEVTTGPLGQGIANAVGLAIAEKHLAAVYNKPGFELFSNNVFTICGDGCLQEGVAAEAISLAGTMKLGKLVLLYDDNQIQIDGSTELAFTENIPMRFESMGWNVLHVANGDTDHAEIYAKIEEAKKLGAETSKPTIVVIKTTIGFHAAKQGTEEVHGSPLGAKDLAAVKAKLGFDPEQCFAVKDEVYETYKTTVEQGAKLQAEYDELLAKYKAEYPELYAELYDRMTNKGLPANWKEFIPKYNNEVITDGVATKAADATRNTSGIVLNAFAPKIKSLVGGSADLTPSNKTWLDCSKNFEPTDGTGRYLRFGVREHAMAAIGNGLEAYGGFIPFTATFLNFIEYAYGAVRLSALSPHKQIFVMTHDSIGLGEDGPTHQPIEVFALMRATPNMLTFRPADANEVSGAYAIALQHQGPSVLCLSRQNVSLLPTSTPSNVLKGGYIVKTFLTEATNGQKLVLIGTGSEVDVALATAKFIVAQGAAATYQSVQVVSMPSLELFDQQTVEYRQSVLPRDALIISIEPSTQNGWEKYAHRHIAMTSFGESAPTKDLYKHFGFDAEQIVAKIGTFVEDFKAAQIPVGQYPLLQAQYVAAKNNFNFEQF
eukprot:UN04825